MSWREFWYIQSKQISAEATGSAWLTRWSVARPIRRLGHQGQVIGWPGRVDGFGNLIQLNPDAV